jgi:hypothetical protein
VTHNYKRHGQTTLYAVLELKSGLVFADCLSPPLPQADRPHQR